MILTYYENPIHIPLNSISQNPKLELQFNTLKFPQILLTKKYVALSFPLHMGIRRSWITTSRQAPQIKNLSENTLKYPSHL